MDMTKSRQYYFVCPRCNRIQVMPTSFMDGFVDCTCRGRFYAYADFGMSLVMPASEVNQEPAARAVYRFLKSVRDNSSEPYEENTRQRLSRALVDYQEENYGESRITVEVLDFIDSAFKRDKGVVLVDKRDDIDMREMTPPKRVSKPKRASKPRGAMGMEYKADHRDGHEEEGQVHQGAV